MKFSPKKLITSVLIALTIITLNACSKDNDNPTETEITVTTTDFSKTMDENPLNGQIIGTVQGSTNEGAVTFSITAQNPSGAFSIDAASGELKVADKTLFDFETNPTITGTVKVANGAVSKNASVTITLNDVSEENIYDGSIQLKTQQEVDNFGENNYTKITGSITIGYLEGEEFTSDIYDLLPLKSIEIVGYSLSISKNPNLISTEGLNIKEIGSQLFISENPSLEELKGFNNLTNLSFGILMYYNENLADFSNLSGITQLGRLIIINNAIENMDWLANLTSITAGEININYCQSLKNIDGLSNLTVLTGEYTNVDISDNTILENLNGLQNLTASVRELRIENNNSLLSLHGIENIIPIYNLNISNNNSLQNLNGLENITELLDQLTIFRNNSLIDLHGLDNLNSVNSFVTINNNEKLSSLNGLENLSQVFILETGINPQLSNFCALQHLVSEDPNTSLNIHHNAYNPTKQDIIDGNCSL